MTGKHGVTISEISQSVCPLSMVRLHEGEIVGTAAASGFFWRADKQRHAHRHGWFVITNWHNVTGINPETRKGLGQFIPNKIDVTARCITGKEGELSIYRALRARFDLYDGDRPLWIEHPLGREVDCVAIPIDITAFHMFSQKALNDCDLQTDLEPIIGMDCFVVGYPLGLTGRVATPIWKKASIATEPELDHDRLPLLLVDTATRQGMSGSPVILRHSGLHMPSGELTDDTIMGTVVNILGIYSGRTGDDELGGQLGRVWKKRVIEEIFQSGVSGTHPNEL